MLKRLAHLFFRLAPSSFSLLPGIQKWVRHRLGGVVCKSAKIHFTATCDCPGCVTIGANVVIEKDVRILTSWKLYDRDGQNQPESGDVIIHESAQVKRGLTIHPGSIIYPGETITSQAEADLVRGRVFEPKGTPASIEETALLRKKQPLFIVGTGRSATTSLAKIQPDAGGTGRHEAFAWLNALGYKKHLHEESIRSELLLRWQAFYANDNVVIESDQRFFNLIPEVADIFPKARFLHVIRSAKGFVKSAKALGWFQIPEPAEHRWSYYRIKPTDTKDTSWYALSQEERLLWYWEFVNSTIQRELQKVPPAHQKTIWLESESFASDASEFIGLSNMDIPKANTSKHKKSTKTSLSQHDLARCNEVEERFREQWKSNWD